MKLSANAPSALQQPDTRSVAFEMTDERKARFKAASAEITEVLKRHTESPAEGYMVLQFVISSMEECYGIRGAITVDHSDRQH